MPAAARLTRCKRRQRVDPDSGPIDIHRAERKHDPKAGAHDRHRIQDERTIATKGPTPSPTASSANREGDLRTPAGIVPLRNGFGVNGNPSLGAGSWLTVDAPDVWVDPPNRPLQHPPALAGQRPV